MICPPLGESLLENCYKFGKEKPEWWVYQMVEKKFENMFTCFDTIHECDRHRTDGHHMTAKATLGAWLGWSLAAKGSGKELVLGEEPTENYLRHI